MRIRTYNVLAMTPQAGLIEFVDDTVSLGGYLYGSLNAEDEARSAHYRFHPEDYLFKTCLQELSDASKYDQSGAKSAAKASGNNNKGGSATTAVYAKRLETFLKIKKRFRPVFRHFVRDYASCWTKKRKRSHMMEKD